MSMFSFIENCQTVFSGCTILYSHPTVLNKSYLAACHHRIRCCRFWILALSTFVVISPCVSCCIPPWPMCGIFHMLIAVCISSLVEVSLKVFGSFVGLFVYLLLNFRSSLYIFWIMVLYQSSFANFFFKSVVCLSSDAVFHRAEVLN